MEKKNNKSKKVQEVIKAYNQNEEQIPSDTFGSYTGMTEDNEKPVQDADDI